MRTFPSSRLSLARVLASTFVWAACSDTSPTPSAPDFEADVLASVVTAQDLSPVIDVQRRHTPALRRTAGVIGTAVGLNPNRSAVPGQNTSMWKMGETGRIEREFVCTRLGRSCLWTTVPKYSPTVTINCELSIVTRNCQLS